MVFRLVADTKAPRLNAISLAGFGAVAFFRTSPFTVRVGGTDIGIGPSSLLQSLLGAADRKIGRDQAQGRAIDAAGIMRDVDFRLGQKAIILGVYLIRQVGADVLDLAVQALGAEIRKQPSTTIA